MLNSSSVTLFFFANFFAFLIKDEKVIFGGRLAEYKYYDMHQIIASALKFSKK
jgi:UDP-galactopyranose mutase